MHCCLYNWSAMSCYLRSLAFSSFSFLFPLHFILFALAKRCFFPCGPTYHPPHHLIAQVRGELERLRADLELTQKAKLGKATTAGSASEICPLPALVPNLPHGLCITAEMQQLLQTLLAPAPRSPQVGFCGMGGIGKTVVSTWIVRQNSVRMHFDHIVWVSFGQTPSIEKCQALVFMQLVGAEVNRDLSEDEVRQSLKQAFAGKKVLLVCDDVWEDAHAKQVCFLDDTTPSKVLKSSRVRGVLEGGTIVDLKLPSDADAVQMLLNEAGMVGVDPSNAPPEAAEVVAFCNNLPLAVGIAGT